METFKHKRFLILLLCLPYCLVAHANWYLVYKNDKQGSVLAGDKKALFQAVRSGSSIRVVWKASRPDNPTSFVEHVIEPKFITNASDQDIFVQTPEHIAQTSYWDTEFQDFSSASIVWRGLLSTNGRFMAVWYNRATGQVVRKAPQRVEISWFTDTKPN